MEKHKVSCSGLLPKTSPMQQSCSHYNAFCSTTYISMQPLQCDSHPCVAEHQGRTDYIRVETIQTATAAHRRYPSSPPTATLLYGYGKTQSFVLRLPPQHKSSPMQHSCSHCNAFCNSTCTFIQHVTTSLSHHFPQSPCFVTTLRHHPSPSPFVITSLNHHPSLLLLCDVLFYDVLLCDVKSHNSICPQLGRLLPNFL